MFNCESGKMRVLHEVGLHARIAEKLSEHRAMVLSRLRKPYALGINPVADLLPGGRYGLGPLEYARIRGDSQKRKEAGPGQSDGRHAVQTLVEPLPGTLVLRKVLTWA